MLRNIYIYIFFIFKIIFSLVLTKNDKTDDGNGMPGLLAGMERKSRKGNRVQRLQHFSLKCRKGWGDQRKGMIWVSSVFRDNGADGPETKTSLLKRP